MTEMLLGRWREMAGGGGRVSPLKSGMPGFLR